MRIQLANGKWIKISFTKEQTKKIYEKAYEKEIATGKVLSWDIEHPVRNMVADREIGFAHPEYWKTRDYYTFSHKVDLVVFLVMNRIDIWESDPLPVTETVGQLLCYREWIKRDYPGADIRMNYVTYKKFSEVDKIAYDFGISTWLVAFANDEISHLEKYETKEW